MVKENLTTLFYISFSTLEVSALSKGRSQIFRIQAGYDNPFPQWLCLVWICRNLGEMRVKDLRIELNTTNAKWEVETMHLEDMEVTNPVETKEPTLGNLNPSNQLNLPPLFLSASLWKKSHNEGDKLTVY